MKVILLKDVPKVGKKHEIKDVSDGFAQNALFPKKLAQVATPQAICALKETQEKAEKIAKQEVEILQKAIEQLRSKKILIELAANDRGHLFSKFKIEQLRKVFKEKGIEFNTTYIIPFEFKEIGVHIIKVKSPHVVGEFEIEIKKI